MMLPEMAASLAAVLLRHSLLTTSMPAAAISSGRRLGCGVYMRLIPTSWSSSRARYSFRLTLPSMRSRRPRGSGISPWGVPMP